MRIILYQPDIPQNTAAIFRLCAGFGVGLDLVGPLGFVMGSSRFRRVAMDYARLVDWRLHEDWPACRLQAPGRLVLLTRSGEIPYTSWGYRAEDSLVLGRESAGFPDALREEMDGCVSIPMAAGVRSMNQVTAAAVGVSEGLRQLRCERSGA